MKASRIVIMGVSGSGKTTVGRRLAEALGGTFVEGDAHHSPANIDKMSRGMPLQDEDRAPWLESLRQVVHAHTGGRPLVLACSALKQRYRDVLATGNEGIVFVYLKGDFDTIHRRMESREGHYMKADLLRSQFDALEEPTDAIVISVSQSVEDAVERIRDRLSSLRPTRSG